MFFSLLFELNLNFYMSLQCVTWLLCKCGLTVAARYLLTPPFLHFMLFKV